MAKKIQIICTRPGMRRMGVEHSATQTYDEGHWSAEQLEAFRADSSFIVQEIDENAVVTRGPEFDQAVADEVSRQVSEKYMALQLSFNTAVNDAAAEKVKLAVDAKQAEVDLALKAGMTVLETENGELKSANTALSAQLKQAGEENATLKAKTTIKK